MNKLTGDITTVTSGVIAHGVNCQTAMGSGVAKALYTKWPRVKLQYLEKRIPTLGSVDDVRIDKDLIIYNCYTQFFYGRDKEVYADARSIYKCLSYVANMHNEINIPLIGCGLGGLKESQLMDILERIESESECIFNVWYLEEEQV